MELPRKVTRLEETDLQSLFQNAAPASAFAFCCASVTVPAGENRKEAAMLGPMTPITEAVLARVIEEEAARKQEEQRRDEKDLQTPVRPKNEEDQV